jgi:hypothetical protein
MQPSAKYLPIVPRQSKGETFKNERRTDAIRMPWFCNAPIKMVSVCDRGDCPGDEPGPMMRARRRSLHTSWTSTCLLSIELTTLGGAFGQLDPPFGQQRGCVIPSRIYLKCRNFKKLKPYLKIYRQPIVSVTREDRLPWSDGPSRIGRPTLPLQATARSVVAVIGSPASLSIVNILFDWPDDGSGD